MHPNHYNELAALDRDYWWFLVRYKIAAWMLGIGHSDSGGRSVLDWGCGTGGFLAYLRDYQGIPSEQLFGYEPSPLAQDVLEDRKIRHCNNLTVPLEQQLPWSPSNVVLLDVLEHLDNPVDTLASLRDISSPGALLLVMVPAFNHLWSAWDIRLEHRRRYSRGLLAKQISDAGWTLRGTRFLFSALYPVAFWRRLSVSYQVTATEFPRVSPFLNATLQKLFYWESLIPLRPVGTSLVAVAENA